MSNSLSLSTLQLAKSFTLVEGSNYKLIIKVGEPIVVDFEQFKRIANSLFNTDADFITINESMVHRFQIARIDPTDEPTKSKLKEKEGRIAKQRAAEQRKAQLESVKASFDRKFFDKAYGVSRWRKWSWSKFDSEHVLTEKDYNQANSAFALEFPSESKELDDIIGGTSNRVE